MASSLLDILKFANAKRNKQAHRVSSDTKRGRQMIAAQSKQFAHIEPTKQEGGNARETRESSRTGTDSKTDI